MELAGTMQRKSEQRRTNNIRNKNKECQHTAASPGREISRIRNSLLRISNKLEMSNKFQ